MNLLCKELNTILAINCENISPEAVFVAAGVVVVVVVVVLLGPTVLAVVELVSIDGVSDEAVVVGVTKGGIGLKPKLKFKMQDLLKKKK